MSIASQTFRIHGAPKAPCACALPGAPFASPFALETICGRDCQVHPALSELEQGQGRSLSRQNLAFCASSCRCPGHSRFRTRCRDVTLELRQLVWGQRSRSTFDCPKGWNQANPWELWRLSGLIFRHTKNRRLPRNDSPGERPPELAGSVVGSGNST